MPNESKLVEKISSHNYGPETSVKSAEYAGVTTDYPWVEVTLVCGHLYKVPLTVGDPLRQLKRAYLCSQCEIQKRMQPTLDLDI